MAQRKQFKLSVSERRNRHFSDNFKRQKVQELQANKTTIAEIRTQYEVSYNTIYRWVRKFSAQQEKGIRTVVETESDTRELINLKTKNAELERLIGQKQIYIEFLNKMIDLAEDTYGVDIKKKFNSSPSNSFGNIGNDTISL
jgi:transposase